jgi:PIN domain nuclease of toxin-antitoxin system
VKLLLDTQCWLWWFAQPDHLNAAAIAAISDETNELWLSVASVWEMGIKVALGKLPLPEPLDSYLPSRMAQLGVRSLDIRAAHALQAAFLPLHHRDPFDRMLIAQAQVEQMTVATSDSQLKLYEVPLLWANA